MCQLWGGYRKTFHFFKSQVRQQAIEVLPTSISLPEKSQRSGCHRVGLLGGISSQLADCTLLSSQVLQTPGEDTKPILQGLHPHDLISLQISLKGPYQVWLHWGLESQQDFRGDTSIQSLTSHSTGKIIYPDLAGLPGGSPPPHSNRASPSHTEH